jgi:Uma2 family endonuclease
MAIVENSLTLHLELPDGMRRMTVADVAALPEELPSGPVHFELDNGRLLAMAPPGDIHGAVQSNLSCQLKIQAEYRGLGKTRTEVGVILWKDPDRLVGPDALFIANKSLPLNYSPEGYLVTIPELVVEIRSKNDSIEQLARKTADYLTAGVEVVWIADPQAKTVTAHTQDGQPLVFGQQDELTIEAVIPEFRVKVAELFQL